MTFVSQSKVCSILKRFLKKPLRMLQQYIHRSVLVYSIIMLAWGLTSCMTTIKNLITTLNLVFGVNFFLENHIGT